MPGFTFSELNTDDPRWAAALGSVTHDIYHLPGYVALEAARMGGRAAAALVTWDDGWLLVPYVARFVTAGEPAQDVSSPYGYAGYLFRDPSGTAHMGGAIEVLLKELRLLGYCSMFLRLHPYLNRDPVGFPVETVHDTGDTVQVDLARPLEALLAEVSKPKRRRAARLVREGLSVAFEPFEASLADFHATYVDTMRRVGAVDEYFSFDQQYFRGLLELLGDRLTIGVVRNGSEVLSTLLISESCGIAHSLFSGTYTSALGTQASVLLTLEAILYCKERGDAIFHLGGGLGGRSDSLFRFKAEFSNGRLPFRTVRAVLDEVVYQELTDRRAQELGLPGPEMLPQDFFPAYRSRAEAVEPREDPQGGGDPGEPALSGEPSTA